MAIANGTATGSTDSRKKVACVFGTFSRTRRDPVSKAKDTYQKLFLVKVRQSTQDALNLTIATPEQQVRVVDGKDIRTFGSDNGKKILIPSPTGLKTKRGAIKKYEIMVPTDATIREIQKFLQASKAEQFSIKGGRTYSVPK